jgi:hypothetical protein
MGFFGLGLLELLALLVMGCVAASVVYALTRKKD